VAEPGPLIGRGRAADVFDIGAGRVLRRYRDGARHGQVLTEATAMRHLAASGFPVPAVHDADGSDLVMDRLDGISMLTAIERGPWRLGRLADLWAALHRRLAAVPVGALADAGLPVRFGPPESVLHLDFHPDNIMLTPDGPMVIDWSNVALGPAAADVAQSWIIAATSSVDGGPAVTALVRLVRGRLVDRFVDGCGRAAAIAMVPAVAELRLADRNVRPEEADRVRALAAALAPPP
jgi:aminoglycoside phosphotransferase (APT) family kinase protein